MCPVYQMYNFFLTPYTGYNILYYMLCMIFKYA